MSSIMSLVTSGEGTVFPTAAVFIWVVKFQMNVNYWRGVEKLEFFQVNIGM